jgi:hypothetical protein
MRMNNIKWRITMFSLNTRHQLSREKFSGKGKSHVSRHAEVAFPNRDRIQRVRIPAIKRAHSDNLLRDSEIAHVQKWFRNERSLRRILG